jgi:hypothetical protein
VQDAGDIGKGHQTNPGFSAQRTTHSITGSICDAVGLKLHGAPARHENRVGCFYITLSPIVCEDAIMANYRLFERTIITYKIDIIITSIQFISYKIEVRSTYARSDRSIRAFYGQDVFLFQALIG